MAKDLDDLGALSFQELRKLCKESGLSGTGLRSELEERLRRKQAEPADRESKELVEPTTSASLSLLARSFCVSVQEDNLQSWSPRLLLEPIAWPAMVVKTNMSLGDLRVETGLRGKIGEHIFELFKQRCGANAQEAEALVPPVHSVPGTQQGVQKTTSGDTKTGT